jgi:hypothetical protein
VIHTSVYLAAASSPSRPLLCSCSRRPVTTSGWRETSLLDGISGFVLRAGWGPRLELVAPHDPRTETGDGNANANRFHPTLRCSASSMQGTCAVFAFLRRGGRFNPVQEVGRSRTELDMGDYALACTAPRVCGRCVKRESY